MNPTELIVKCYVEHEHWVKVENGKLYKVTVDCPKAPFYVKNKGSVNQTGITCGITFKIEIVDAAICKACR